MLKGWTMKWVLTAVMLMSASIAVAAGDTRDSNKRLAYNGSSMECLVANDFYAVHFTALQPGKQTGEKTEFVKYCREIPSTGMLYLTLDMLDRDVRTTPIALRVVEDVLDPATGKYKSGETLKEEPARIYKSGTADTHIEITRTGHYAVIATFGQDEVIGEDDQLKIPFSVGAESPHKSGDMPKKIAFGMAALFMLFVGWFIFNHIRKTKKFVIENP